MENLIFLRTRGKNLLFLFTRVLQKGSKKRIFLCTDAMMMVLEDELFTAVYEHCKKMLAKMKDKNFKFA